MPAKEICAERSAPVFAATTRLTVADPEPGVEPETVIQLGRLEMAQAQPAPAVTVRVKLPQQRKPEAMLKRRSSCNWNWRE